MVCVSRGAEAVRLAHGFVQAQQGRCLRGLRQTTHALSSARDTALVHSDWYCRAVHRPGSGDPVVRP
jgi:hypothetical protein